MRPQFHVTFEIVTPESAEQGDVADAGFCDHYGNPNGNEPVPVTLRDAVHLVGRRSCEDSGGGWWTSVDSVQDFRTGESTSYSVHPPRNITPASFARVSRVLCFRPRR